VGWKYQNQQSTEWNSTVRLPILEVNCKQLLVELVRSAQALFHRDSLDGLDRKRELAQGPLEAIGIDLSYRTTHNGRLGTCPGSLLAELVNTILLVEVENPIQERHISSWPWRKKPKVHKFKSTLFLRCYCLAEVSPSSLVPAVLRVSSRHAVESKSGQTGANDGLKQGVTHRGAMCRLWHPAPAGPRRGEELPTRFPPLRPRGTVSGQGTGFAGCCGSDVVQYRFGPRPAMDPFFAELGP
jgi:hypothetical protein